MTTENTSIDAAMDAAQFGVLQRSRRRWVVIKLDHFTGHAEYQVPQFEVFSRDFDSELEANAECRRIWRMYHPQVRQHECQQMIILGNDKHYCTREDNHAGTHRSQSGFEWNTSEVNQ